MLVDFLITIMKIHIPYVSDPNNLAIFLILLKVSIHEVVIIDRGGLLEEEDGLICFHNCCQK